MLGARRRPRRLPCVGLGVGLSRSAFTLLCLSLAACATIPKGRYGVEELQIEGTEQLDEHALRACLATKSREDLSLDLSKAPNPSCGKPPFDAEHLRLSLWHWPWKRWPLYEPSVFERDIARVERWYRARGYYDARVTEVGSDPEAALYGQSADPRDNRVKLRLQLSEGRPVLVREVVLEGTEILEEDVGMKLIQEADLISPGDRFDEALFDAVRSRLRRTMRDSGYASAVVESQADIDPSSHSASLRFRLVPGALSELGEVCVQGYEGLPPKLILQASDLVPGQPYSESDIEDARTRIYQMRVFSEVEIVAGQGGADEARAAAPSDLSEGEWMAWDSEGKALPEADEDGAAPLTHRTCRTSRHESARPKIAVEIRVRPAKLWRFGVGTGIQIGVEDYQRAYSAAQQWDVHVFTYLELRNFFGGLRRFRIEERPKLVFLAPFPRSANNEGDRGFEIGNNLSALLEWPAFLENRTLLRVTGVWDRGPDPFGGGFVRDDIDVGIGPSRDFLQNRLHVELAIHENPYLPHANGNPAVAAERYNLLFFKQVLEWDARDDKTSPSRGILARVELHEAIPPSNFHYLRITPELRRYIPLPYGLVLAGRVGIGWLHIYHSDRKTNELRRLGPRPYRLRGGGPYSVRGVQAGQLGLRSIDLEPGPNGQPRGFPGGTRSWIASAELRVPLGESLGVAAFLDAGDVDGGYGTHAARFRFDHPNTTLGTGLRYKTLVGPIRLDVGWLVPGLSSVRDDAAATPKRDPLFKLNGAVHLTIGEAF